MSAAPHVTIRAARCPFRSCTRRRSHVLRAADAALCKSGTTTLEAAVAGCPLVVAYRTSAISLRDRATRREDPVHRSRERGRGTRSRAGVRAGRARAARVADALEPLLDAAESRERATMLDGLADGARAARHSRARRRASPTMALGARVTSSVERDDATVARCAARG